MTKIGRLWHRNGPTASPDDLCETCWVKHGCITVRSNHAESMMHWISATKGKFKPHQFRKLPKTNHI